MNPFPERVLIRAESLTRTYSLGSIEIVGIQDIHLEILKGELVVLRAVSGSGKSTLLALLGGLDQPTRGRLTVDGHDLQGANPEQLNEYRRNTVGMIFQSFNLLPTLTVMENICLPALLAGKPYPSTRKRASAIRDSDWTSSTGSWSRAATRRTATSWDRNWSTKPTTCGTASG